MKAMAIRGFVAALGLASGLVLASEHGTRERLALEILRQLEIDSFANSLRPAHYPTGTTLEQTPYHIFEAAAEMAATYQARDIESSWLYSVTVLESRPAGVVICFVDRSLQGSYLASARLLVAKTSAGHYAALRTLPDKPACMLSR
jgi:hypothetical protein